MDANERLNQIELLIAEMLRKQDQQSAILKTNSEILSTHTEILNRHSGKLDQLIATFNTGFDAMLRKMDDFTNELRGLRQDFQKFADHEERIRKIEDHLFRKGA
jgi:ABC-type transporter Mla subunit MlaD